MGRGVHGEEVRAAERVVGYGAGGEAVADQAGAGRGPVVRAGRGLGDCVNEGGDIADEGADPACVPDIRFQGRGSRAERGGHQRL